MEIPVQSTRSHPLFVRISKDNYQWLKNLSKRTNWTMAQAVDLLIDRLKEEERGKEKKENHQKR